MAKTTKAGSAELPVLLFATQEEWAAWLEENLESAGLWLRMAKKASGIPSIDYQQAVEVALCYGWIDGLKNSFDETSWVQKFTPRGRKSIWSKINREKAQALIDNGKMKASGLAAVKAAQ